MIRRLGGAVPHYDVCIVGAGPAGLTVAAELAYTGLRICVLESGGERRSAATDALKEVETDGLAIKPNSRERVLGGASTVWGGLSAPLDAIDLEPREGGEGWPLAERDLAPYLAAATRYWFPTPEYFSASPTWRLENLSEKIFVAIRPPFNFAHLRHIFERAGVDLYLNATVTRLISKAGKVDSVACRSIDGEEVLISATNFVLAAGGIENPRLLLNSVLGNDRDQVGRYFMNHPKGYLGLVRFKKSLPAESFYLPLTRDGRLRYAGLRLSDEYQRTHSLLNSYVQFEPNLGLLQRYAFGIWKRLPPALSRWLELFRPRTLRLRWFADMEPRAENRITLSPERDALGMPIPHVHYALGEKDKKTFAALHSQLQENIARLNLGTLEGTADEVIAAVTQDASHHLGGTRMGRDPQTSVVDGDCRVHSIRNLYVAGGSVFRAGGCANPTYTIVALAIRLAAHLSGVSKVALPSSGTAARAAGIVIIGAGKRVATDVVPALESLPKEFAIQGLYARHAGALFGSRAQYAVSPLSALTADMLAKARFLYIAVPPQALLSLVRGLPAAPDLELIIDTPVSASAALYRALTRYRRVHVAEDSVFLPWLSLVSKAARIECEHSVYRYHGIALLKALAGTIRFAVRWGNSLWLWAGSTRVRISEPRDYARGTLRIDGREVEMLIIRNRCKGFRFDSSEILLSPEESALAGFVEEGDTVVSRMLELKRVGLRRLLSAAYANEETWSLAQEADDVRVDYFTHRFWAYVRIVGGDRMLWHGEENPRNRHRRIHR